MQSEPHWTSYVAIVTGIIGAFTGIAGSIMGYIAFRKSNEFKKSDRRLDLRKLRNYIDFAAKRLLEIRLKALSSRRSALMERGLLHSDDLKSYKYEDTEDSDRLNELLRQIPREDTCYDSMSLKQLEREWVCLDRIKIEVNDLISKYEGSIQEDLEHRKQHLR